MKKKFRVELFYEAEYPEIEAENEEEAFQQALKMWKECLPNVVVRPADEEKNGKITCNTCPYYHGDDDDESPRCHYIWEDKYAPCDDYEMPDIDDDYGFDPYLGCYTDDC